jgi:hypothetical protein
MLYFTYFYMSECVFYFVYMINLNFVSAFKAYLTYFNMSAYVYFVHMCSPTQFFVCVNVCMVCSKHYFVIVFKNIIHLFCIFYIECVRKVFQHRLQKSLEMWAWSIQCKTKKSKNSFLRKINSSSLSQSSTFFNFLCWKYFGFELNAD